MTENNNSTMSFDRMRNMLTRAAEIRESEQQQIFDALDEIHARMSPLESLGSVRKRLSELPDGPEREALFFEAKLLATAYMPYKMNVHRISTDLCGNDSELASRITAAIEVAYEHRQPQPPASANVANDLSKLVMHGPFSPRRA